MSFSPSVPKPVVSAPRVTPPATSPDGTQDPNAVGDAQKRRLASMGKTVSTSSMGLLSPAVTAKTSGNLLG